MSEFDFDALERSLGQAGRPETDPDIVVDADALDVMRELAACSQLAHDTRSKPLLAAFDLQSCAIWGNEALARAIGQNRQRLRLLRDEDVETLAHEFARALEYESIFENSESHAKRLAAITRQLGLTVRRSTEESYMNQMLARERRAEEAVQRIRLEILSNFDLSQRGHGLNESQISDAAVGEAAQWIDGHRDDYRSKARSEYRRLVMSQSVGRLPEQVAEDLRARQDLSVVSIRSCTGMFPTRLSATLDRMLDKLSRYELNFVVPTIAAREQPQAL